MSQIFRGFDGVPGREVTARPWPKISSGSEETAPPPEVLPSRPDAERDMVNAERDFEKLKTVHSDAAESLTALERKIADVRRSASDLAEGDHDRAAEKQLRRAEVLDLKRTKRAAEVERLAAAVVELGVRRTEARRVVERIAVREQLESDEAERR